MLISKFKTPAVVVYCDRSDHARLERVTRAMSQARRQLPLKIESDKEGASISSNDDVLFIVSTVKELMPVTKLTRNEVQAVFIHP